MAAVTWKNIAPSNPSGILNAANQAARGMSEGLGTIGENINQFATDKETSETNAFVADLMNAGSQEERDAMISAANQSWLNLDQVNKTNYELGAPDREMDMFNQQLAAEAVVNEEAAQKLHDNKILQIEAEGQFRSPSKSGTPKKQGNSGTVWGSDPTGKDGIFQNVNKYDETFWGGGSGFDQDDIIAFNNSKQSLLSSDVGLSGKVTAEEINQLANDSLITFKDNISLPFASQDEFAFTGIDGEDYVLDDSPESQAALVDLIYYKYRGKDDNPGLSTRMVNTNEYFKVFRENNPDIVEKQGIDEAKRIFNQIYNQNVGNKDQQLYNENLATKIFGEVKSSQTVSNELRESPNYQRFYDNALNQFDSRAYDDEDIKRLFKRYSEAEIGKDDAQNLARLDALTVLYNALDK